jgi:hypothetical protein
MNTRYYLDTEFNSFGGSLISLGIVRHDDPNDHLYLFVPKVDIERMRVEEDIDPWIEENVLKNLYALPDDAHAIEAPVHQWGPLLADFIYRGDEITQVLVDWPSDAMDFCKLLMIGPGKAVPMLNQTHVTILRHIDVYPTSLEGAVQHNALWDALAIRQLLIEMEDSKERPVPKSPIEKLGRPMNHDSETQAAIERLGEEFHKTRLSQNVCVDPGDLSLALKALGYYG